MVPRSVPLLEHISADSVRYVHPYYPTWTNKFDRNSERILDFKDGEGEAFRHYLNVLNEALPRSGTVVPVPSHAPSNRGSVVQLASELGNLKKRVDGSDCLVRHTKIDKLSEGGNRNPAVHVNSVKVENETLIANRPAILIDDVVTSGGSMKGCSYLLSESGAQKVYCVSLSRTKH